MERLENSGIKNGRQVEFLEVDFKPAQLPIMAATSNLLRGLCLLFSFLCLGVRIVSGDAVSTLQANGRAALNAQLATSTTCSSSQLAVRKEW